MANTILIAYFSRTGHAKEFAQIIQKGANFRPHLTSAYDFSGKAVIRFATSGDVDLERTESDLRHYHPQSSIKKRTAFASLQSVREWEKVKDWLGVLN